MKESIQQSGSEVSIVIYDAPLPPKYFRFSKRFIRTLFVTLPVVFCITLSTLFLWGLAARIKQAPRPSLPQMTNENEIRLAELQTEVLELQQSNQKLIEKIEDRNIPAEDDQYLMGIRKPYGMQNLTSQNIISLGPLDLKQEGNKTSLKFQIINPNPEKKISGHIVVFMISESGVLAYPSSINESLVRGIKYSAGESFSVSRLRPTVAEFLNRPAGSTVRFMIYVFNREGDLLITSETESFKVGPNS